MARSVWKGPFVEESLIKKVEKLKSETVKKPIKTWSRKSTIIPEFVTFFFIYSLILKSSIRFFPKSFFLAYQTESLLKSIVGKKVDIAIRNLSFSDKRISKDIKKTISSAVANAENNYQYDIDKLIIKEAYCGKQVVMKRFRARAKGRAAEIMKPYSNLTIILSEQTKQMEGHGTKS